ncbi:MAG: beta-lactamase family protein [Acidobacteria bacterium]|nr:beta-lactamase family protein [Acidobacteriota bacterium]
MTSAVPLAASSGFDGAVSAFYERTKRQVDSDGIGGIAMGVVAGGRLRWKGACGYADSESRRPMEADQICRIGSITKSFTAVLLMDLLDKRIVSLEDPVHRYVPEIMNLAGRTEWKRDMTLRDLACHTGGIPRMPNLPGARSGPDRNWAEKVIQSIAATPIQRMPGEKYEYSNIGYSIVGLCLQRAARRDYFDMQRETVLTPLGMKDTGYGFGLTPEQWKRVATGYDNERGGRPDTETPRLEHKGRGFPVPAGSLYSTVEDMARHLLMLSGATVNVLSPSGRELMESPQADTGKGAYGFALSIRKTREGMTIIGHSGAISGYTSYIAFDRRSRAGVVMLRNYNSGSTVFERDAALALHELSTCL